MRLPANPLLCTAGLLLLTTTGILSWKKIASHDNKLIQQSSHLITINNYTFRDLNKNGKLDVYEDTRQPVEARVNDLLGQLTLTEKAGLMFINGARINEDGSIEDKPATGLFAFAPNAVKLMKEKEMNHFNLWAVPAAPELAKWYNAMQHFAEDSTRLGIPITIASDP